MKTRWLATIAALALAAGCASPAADAPPDSAELASTRAVAGAFTVALDGHKVKFNYKLSQIDMTAKTVVWNAKVTDNGGHPNVWDDEDVHGKITRVARCMGCFTAEMPGSNAFPLAIVNVSAFEATSIKYEDVDAKLSAANDAGAEQDEPASPDDIGACTQSCSGTEACKPDVARSECKSGSGLFPVYRCPTTYTFAADQPCPR